MSPATWPRSQPLDDKLLVVDARAGAITEARVGGLPGYLRADDLIVVNDAATLPASIAAVGPAGERIEVRLLAPANDGSWPAVLLGAGDWRTRTEDRAAPPVLRPGERVAFDASLGAEVTGVSDLSPRLVSLRFDREGGALWTAIYRLGRPVQYAHIERTLPLWHVQTAYAARPWASELPSAGRPLSWGLLTALRAKGVGLAPLTHAAGLSSTGDAALDEALPLREAYDLPAPTVAAIERARARRGRVVAIGTSVVRALEGVALAHDGRLVAGAGETELRIGAAHERRVVDALFTGVHAPGTSHFDLLRAFAPEGLLLRASTFAEQRGFLGHEMGDSALILATPAVLRTAGNGSRAPALADATIPSPRSIPASSGGDGNVADG